MDVRSTNRSVARISLLRRVAGVCGWTEEELAGLEPLVEETSVPAGQEVATGALGDVVVITDGWAAIMVDDEPSAALGPGDIVEGPCPTDGPRTRQRVVAKTDVRVITVPRRALDR